MRESELLAHIAARSADLRERFAHALIGPGDDAAVLAPPGGRVLATVDHLIEGRHFAGPIGAKTTIDAIARKAVARSLSDIAAMGGSVSEWGAALATAAMPKGFTQEQSAELFDCLQRSCAQWHVPLVGGDAATFGEGAHPLTITVTAMGLAHPARGPVLRSGAKAGDTVYVTGKLGGSFASGRHLSFEPRLNEARELCDSLGEKLHAMIDISDGLGRDAARIARASSATIEIDSSSVPCHAGSDWQRALRDGEDYELLFTVAPDAPVASLKFRSGAPITRLGIVRAPASPAEGGRCFVRAPGGRTADVSDEGWDHT